MTYTENPIKTDLGEAPKHLTEDQIKAWDDLLGAMPGYGVMRPADRLTLEILAKLVAKSRNNELTDAAQLSLINMLGRFGMNPSDRQKIKLDVDLSRAATNPYNDL